MDGDLPLSEEQLLVGWVAASVEGARRSRCLGPATYAAADAAFLVALSEVAATTNLVNILHDYKFTEGIREQQRCMCTYQILGMCPQSNIHMQALLVPI